VIRSWPVLFIALGLLASGCGDPDPCDLDDDGAEGLACGGEDCNDEDPTVSPSADELCDDIDHNCDLWVHLDAVDGVPVYDDSDGDGYGDPDTQRLACAASWPETAEGGDCDDEDAATSPETVWYADTDGDGLGDPDNTTVGCLQPDGFVSNNQDADDTDPASAGCWTGITVGRDHSCALKTDGSIACWGSNGAGQTSVPEGNSFTEVSAGYRNTCAVDGATQEISCWGSNSYGESSPPDSAFTSVSCGLSVCCGLLASGDDNVVCWGDGSFGQTTTPSGTFTSVSAGGGRHTCGVRDSGELDCWGSSDPFQGAGQSPTDAPDGTFSDSNSGHFFSCAVDEDGAGTCWGTNGYGQGDVPDGEWLEIKAGTVHSCGLEVDGTISCWGSDSYDRTNNPPDLTTQIDVNQLHSCGIGADGIIRCWGLNEFGQLDPPPC